VLTADALEKLLQALGSDGEDAGRRYETIRRRLVRFFRGRACDGAESLADETIDRVCRRMDEGRPFDGRPAYFYGVARNVLREHARRQRRFQAISALLTEPSIGREAPPIGSEDEKMMCLGWCLSELPAVDRILIQHYYFSDEAGDDPGYRAELARQMGISHTNLRQRAFRIRRRLEECFRRCLARRQP